MADTPTIWQQNTPWAVHSICTDHHVTLTLMQDPCLLAWWTRTFSVAGSSRASYRVDYRGITTNVNPRLDSPDVTMSAHKPIRLPPLKTLRVRAPNAKPERPCMAIMSSVLSCWASVGYSIVGCAQVEQALRACMDGPRPPPPRKSEVNYHLGRFKNTLTYPEKKKR
ncbi:hypothetical protein F4825DRAFT_128986 [Nemania diffusa]|nr:hypothetical protein F4825DRAFT_128986 [Nemania diffusa]